MNEIIKDIYNYIIMLRQNGHFVTVSCFDSIFSPVLPTLLELEIHLMPICSYLKANENTFGMCAENKRRLNLKAPTKPFYSCCYAGVEEYVLPIIYNNKPIICVNISGFRDKLKKSAYFKGKTCQMCDERFNELYSELKTDVIDMDKAKILAKPLEYMFKELYESCKKTDALMPSDELYNEILRYIYDNYMNKLTAKIIADNLNYSASYIRFLFKQKSGTTLNSYIKDVRLSKAEHLLKATTLNITQIAFNTGFCDANYFSVSFSDKFKLSPKKYREKAI